jgi:hypothetical protein
VGTAALGCPGRAKPDDVLADVTSEVPMSTRSSIWLGESKGKSVHIYWELAERETGYGRTMRAPIYLAVVAGDADQEVAIRLPKGVAIRLLTALSPHFADEVAQVI